ncbi:MAG: hypothetical protein Q7R96_06280 [Nanoarchaeota archaeon]|nr:hypothetical protein [Nanoarchaeota archaeon]
MIKLILGAAAGAIGLGMLSSQISQKNDLEDKIKSAVVLQHDVNGDGRTDLMLVHPDDYHFPKENKKPRLMIYLKKADGKFDYLHEPQKPISYFSDFGGQREIAPEEMDSWKTNHQRWEVIIQSAEQYISQSR